MIGGWNYDTINRRLTESNLEVDKVPASRLSPFVVYLMRVSNIEALDDERLFDRDSMAEYADLLVPAPVRYAQPADETVEDLQQMFRFLIDPDDPANMALLLALE